MELQLGTVPFCTLTARVQSTVAASDPKAKIYFLKIPSGSCLNSHCRKYLVGVWWFAPGMCCVRLRDTSHIPNWAFPFPYAFPCCPLRCCLSTPNSLPPTKSSPLVPSRCSTWTSHLPGHGALSCKSVSTRLDIAQSFLSHLVLWGFLFFCVSSPCCSTFYQFTK